MQKKTIVTLIIVAVVMTGVIIGAVFLYDFLKESAPDDMLLQPPVGGQTGGAGAPSAPSGTTPTKAPAGQDNGAESPTPAGQEGESESAAPGEADRDKVAAPDFTVQDADGNDVKLSDLQGKPVVLNFWASWCPPCKEEMPYFNNVYEDLGSEVHFMMVCLADGARETKESGMAFIEDKGFTFPVYFDMSGEASAAYGIQSIPATYFIDADGYLVTRAEGGIPEGTLRLGVSYILE